VFELNWIKQVIHGLVGWCLALFRYNQVATIFDFHSAGGVLKDLERFARFRFKAGDVTDALCQCRQGENQNRVSSLEHFQSGQLCVCHLFQADANKFLSFVFAPFRDKLITT
jgi:hypothetical protein